MKYSKLLIILLSVIFISILIIRHVLRNKKENFTLPNFIQILIASDTAPTTASFTPIYIDQDYPFTIDFGDGTPSVHITDNNIHEHKYRNAGVNHGVISFDNSCVKQKFQIILK